MEGWYAGGAILAVVETARAALETATFNGTELGMWYSDSDSGMGPVREAALDMGVKAVSILVDFSKAGVSSMSSEGKLSEGDTGRGLDGKERDCFSICKKFDFPSLQWGRVLPLFIRCDWSVGQALENLIATMSLSSGLGASGLGAF